MEWTGLLVLILSALLRLREGEETALADAVVVSVLSNIIRLMDIVDGALDNSDGIFFTFIEPRDEQ